MPRAPSTQGKQRRTHRPYPLSRAIVRSRPGDRSHMGMLRWSSVIVPRAQSVLHCCQRTPGPLCFVAERGCCDSTAQIHDAEVLSSIADAPFRTCGCFERLQLEHRTCRQAAWHVGRFFCTAECSGLRWNAEHDLQRCAIQCTVTIGRERSILSTRSAIARGRCATHVPGAAAAGCDQCRTLAPRRVPGCAGCRHEDQRCRRTTSAAPQRCCGHSWLPLTGRVPNEKTFASYAMPNGLSSASSAGRRFPSSRLKSLRQRASNRC